jgi:hypothetical protein
MPETLARNFLSGRMFAAARRRLVADELLSEAKKSVPDLELELRFVLVDVVGYLVLL